MSRGRIVAGALLAVLVLVSIGVLMRRDTAPHEPVPRADPPPIRPPQATKEPLPPVDAARTVDSEPVPQQPLPPLALPERPTSRYTGDRAGLSRGLIEERDAVNSCVFAHTRRTGTAPGRFTITLVLEGQTSSEGVVTAFTSIEGDDELEACIEAVIGRNAFDPPVGDAVEHRMPWVGL